MLPLHERSEENDILAVPVIRDGGSIHSGLLPHTAWRTEDKCHLGTTTKLPRHRYHGSFKF